MADCQPISGNQAARKHLCDFLMVAGFGWCTDALIVYLAVQFGKVPVELANIASSLIAASLVYFLSHNFIYGARHKALRFRLTAYLIYTIALILIMSLILGITTRLLDELIAPGWSLIVGKILITPPQFLLNFLVSRHLATPRRRWFAMSERILLFIPCYNCAPQIGRVLQQLGGPAGRWIDEVLVLDNGSQDGTLDRAAETAASIAFPPIKIARNHENFHLGGSHKAAFAYAREGGFSHVLVLHGDDQGRLNDILAILERRDHLAYDACLGARFMPGATPQGYSRFRHAGNLVFNLLFSIVAGRRIHDLGSGLNLFGRRVFTDPAIDRASDDLRFNIYLLLRLIDGRFRMKFFPISWREEDQQSNVRLFSQAWKTLGIAWEFVARRRHFRTSDHRDRQIADYRFDILVEKGVRARVSPLPSPHRFDEAVEEAPSWV